MALFERERNENAGLRALHHRHHSTLTVTEAVYSEARLAVCKAAGLYFGTKLAEAFQNHTIVISYTALLNTGLTMQAINC